MTMEGVQAGAAAGAEGLSTMKAMNSLQENLAKASKNEQFRNNIVMSLISKMPDGRF
jgi:hypothetical protein